jgi:inner membrane protein involved in colicin E2 resistance
LKIPYRTLIATGLFLTVVAIAERLQPNEVNWSGFDYVIAGLLVFTAGFTLETVMHRWRQHKMRWWIIALILLIFVLLWLELAVGIFGSPFAGS